MRKKVSMILVSLMMVSAFAACGNIDSSKDSSMSEVSAESTEDELEEAFSKKSSSDTNEEDNYSKSLETAESSDDAINEDSDKESSEGDKDSSNSLLTTANVTSDGMIDATDMFTDRDLEQTADLTSAEKYILSDGEDITITSEGVYILSGQASEVTIYVEAGDEDKVQIVLDSATISNESRPAIYVKSADKVFVTTTDSDNTLEVTDTFETAASFETVDTTESLDSSVTTEESGANLDAVIFSKDDLVINGVGTLNISSSDNAVTSKDTLKITGSTINVSCTGNAFEAHDAIEVADGTINIASCNDGLHAENDEDDSVGYIYICGGTFNITASDDAIHATTIVQIDSSNMNLTGAECIEGTYIQINGGDITINASDDGINAASKSSEYTPTFEMNDGTLKVTMGAGDTDGIDSNGNIYVNGGTIDVSGQSTFDYDGEAQYNGGTIIENGTETNTISNQMMGGGPGNFDGGGFGGGKDGGFGGEDFGGPHGY